MKKLALLAAVLLLFGLTAGFADVGVDISGEAEALFAFNLEDQAAGFENDGSVDVIFTFVEEQTIDSGTMDGWYGWIEFADFSVIYDNDSDSDYYQQGFYWDDADEDGVIGVGEIKDQTQILVTEPDITAKITNGMIYVVIYEAPSFDPDHVESVEDDEDDDYVVEDDEQDYSAPDLSEYGGITIGYDAEAFDLEVYAASGDGYDLGDSNDQWLFGAMVAVSAAGAELSADFALASNVDDNDMLFGADASYTLDAGMVAIVPYVGIDYWASDVVDPGIYELAAGLDATFTNDDEIGIAFYYNDTGDVDLEATITEDGEAGFVPGLSAEIVFGGYESFADYRFALDLSYTVGDVEPYAGFDYDSLGNLMAEAGVNWTGIPNTTVWVEWDSNDLDGSDATEPDNGFVGVGAKVEM
jgi:hypothetical protein